MHIAVCIKQVPATTEVAVDETTGVLRRDGIKTRLNPYDLYALEAALRLRKIHGGTTTAITMGPEQAEAILREAFMMGVDESVLLSDRAFAGADVWATARALSGAIHSLGPVDLILCGKQTTDGDTAQVGPEIAQFLNIPHASNVLSLRIDEGYLLVTADEGDSLVDLKMPLPALITLEKGVNTPRLPSYRLHLATRERPVRRLALGDLPDSNAAGYGLRGSPTQVERVFTPSSQVAREIWQGEPQDMARRIAATLFDRKLI